MTGVEISVAEAESLWGLDKAQQKRARSPGRQGGRVVGGGAVRRWAEAGATVQRGLRTAGHEVGPRPLGKAS